LCFEFFVSNLVGSQLYIGCPIFQHPVDFVSYEKKSFSGIICSNGRWFADITNKIINVEVRAENIPIDGQAFGRSEKLG
jgi:hypothetical protein